MRLIGIRLVESRLLECLFRNDERAAALQRHEHLAREIRLILKRHLVALGSHVPEGFEAEPVDLV